jgi:hypothetical protein
MGRRSPDRLYEEVAFVAYHFNWSHDTVLGLPHDERERWCAEISRINERMNRSSGPPDARGDASGATELADLAGNGGSPTGPPAGRAGRGDTGSAIDGNADDGSAIDGNADDGSAGDGRGEIDR